MKDTTTSKPRKSAAKKFVKVAVSNNIGFVYVTKYVLLGESREQLFFTREQAQEHARIFSGTVTPVMVCDRP